MNINCIIDGLVRDESLLINPRVSHVLLACLVRLTVGSQMVYSDLTQRLDFVCRAGRINSQMYCPLNLGVFPGYPFIPTFQHSCNLRPLESIK